MIVHNHDHCHPLPLFTYYINFFWLKLHFLMVYIQVPYLLLLFIYGVYVACHILKYDTHIHKTYRNRNRLLSLVTWITDVTSRELQFVYSTFTKLTNTYTYETFFRRTRPSSLNIQWGYLRLCVVSSYHSSLKPIKLLQLLHKSNAK